MATLDAKCDATSTHDTCTRYVRISSSILVVLNFPSSLCFLLDRYLFFLSSTVSVSLLVVPYSPFPEICLPSGRDRPFGATGCSRVPIVGAHNATRAAIDKAHLVSSNGGRTAVTRGNDAREEASTSYGHTNTHARAFASSSSTGTAVSSSCVFARVQDTYHRAQHPRSTMGDPRPTAPPPRRIAVRRRK